METACLGKSGQALIMCLMLAAPDGPNVKFVDVTEALIQPFKSTDETLEIIQYIRKVPPASEKEIRELEESGKEI